MRLPALSFAVLLACVHASGAAIAGTVTVSDGPAKGSIIVEASDATLTEILSHLAKAKGVHFQGTAEASLRSGHWQGTLTEVLARLLKNDNHVIAMTGDMRRVILLGDGAASEVAVADAAPSADASEPAATNTEDSPKPPKEAQAKQLADGAEFAAGLNVASKYGHQLLQQFGFDGGPVASSGYTGSAAEQAALTQSAAQNAQAVAASLKSLWSAGPGR